jgi:hypothetical protein
MNIEHIILEIVWFLFLELLLFGGFKLRHKVGAKKLKVSYR